MLHGKLIFFAAAIMTALTITNAQESKFNFSGFIDGRMYSNFYGPHSFYNLIGLDTGFQINIDHVNLYADFKPNNHSRALVEIRYLHEPQGLNGTVGTFTNIRMKRGQGSVPFIQDTTFATLPENTTVTDWSTGGYLTWGGISIERAQFDLLFNKTFNFRFGKFITPAGIWNVDHGSPVITTVQQPYLFSFCTLFPTSQAGLMEFGKAFFGNCDLDWSLYISNGRNGITSYKTQDLGAGGKIGLTTPGLDYNMNLGFGSVPVLGSIECGISAFTGKLRKNVRYMTLAFTADPMSEGDPIGEGFANPNYRTYWDSTYTDQRETVGGINLKFPLFKYLTVQSEAIYQKLDNNLKSSDSSVSSIWGWYILGQVKLRVNSSFSILPYICYEQISSKDAPNNPGNRFAGDAKFGGQSLDGFSTLSTGLNLRFFSNVILKLEYSAVDAHMVKLMAKYQDAFDKSTFTTQFCIAF